MLSTCIGKSSHLNINLEFIQFNPFNILVLHPLLPWQTCCTLYFPGRPVAPFTSLADLLHPLLPWQTCCTLYFPSRPVAPFTSLADLFNPTPSQLPWEAPNHATINKQKLVASYSFIHLSELEQARVKNLPMHRTGFEPTTTPSTE